MRFAAPFVVALVLSHAAFPAHGHAGEPDPPFGFWQGTITGQVTDATTQQPIAGATVTVVGTELGAMTGSDGEFRIVGVPAGTYRLRVDVIGYGGDEQSVSVAEEETSTVNFALEREAMLLDELVVIGYGTARARTVTGSVARLGVDEVRDVPVANATTLLQGKLPGVVVSSYSAQPGRDAADIKIRGIGTLNAGENPLVIIDGVTASAEQFGQIPAGDIADVTVLKDAASAAIYGARAANGVILVETRQGGRGSPPQVTFRSTVTQQRPLVDLELLDSWDYARIVNEWQVAEGSEPLYTDEMIQAMRDGSAPDQFANTNWYREVVRPARMQEHYAAVTGGSSATRYRISGEYRDQQGIMRGTDAKQFSVRSNLDVDLGTRARAGLDLSGYWEGIDQPSVVNASGGESAVLYQVRRFAKPTIPVQYSNGEWGVVDGLYPDWGFPISNPLQAVGLGENQEDQYRVSANLLGEIDLLPNLVVQSRVSGTYYSSASSRFWPTNRSYDAAGELISNDPTNALSNENDTEYQLLNANTFTYRPTVGRHSFTLLGGQSVEYFRQDHVYAHAEGFPNDNVRELTAGVENLDVDGWAQDNALFSLFGRVSYVYDDRYLFDANLRYDGSSRFAKDNRFALFPSFSAGWIVSEEPFMRGLSVLDFLKLRGSWGRLGNQEINGNYPYSQTYAADQNYIIGNELVGGAAITDLANSDITWETTTVTDVGVDVHLLDSRLTVVADYFDKRSSDILLQLPIPGNQGDVSAPYQNVGEVQNKGWELSLSYTHPLNPDAELRAGFNISRVRNKVLDLGARGDTELGGWISGNTVVVEGEPIDAYWGYVAEGFFQTQEEVDNHATQFGDLAPGDIKFRDLNGDGMIDPENDRTIIGQPFPDYSLGINLGGRYKSFTVDAFLQGIRGIERFNWYNNELTGSSSFTESVLDNWSEDNPDATFPRFGNWANNNEMSSYWLDDASYLRLKHVQVGYALPETFTQRLSFDTVRLFAAGYNLMTFTDVKEYDPEKAASDERNFGYPGLRSFAIGLELTP